MDSDNEQRSYGSYLSRVFGIIVVVILIILSVWFVVQIATDDGDDAPQEETSSLADENGVNEDATIVDEAISDGNDAVSPGDVNGGTDGEQGRTLSTNTDDLPDTGPGDMLWVLPVGAAVYAGSRYIETRRET